MVLAGMTYSEERAEQVDFSEVYYETNSKFVVPVGEEGNFESIEDFAKLTKITFFRLQSSYSDFMSWCIQYVHKRPISVVPMAPISQPEL